MKRTAFVIKLKSGMKEEYKKRHDNLWPEIREMMTRRGIRNYTIWYYEDLLFAYYQTDEEASGVPMTKEEEDLDDRWADYMSDIIEIVTDPATGETLELECLFLHE